MNNEIMEYFSLLVKEKGIDRDYLEAVIKDIFETLVKKKFGPNANSDIIVNMEKGGIEIYYEREIVEELEDPVTQISIDEVNELGNEDELEVGDVYLQKIEPHEFGRRLINMARQTLSQKNQRDWKRNNLQRLFCDDWWNYCWWSLSNYEKWYIS